MSEMFLIQILIAWNQAFKREFEIFKQLDIWLFN